MHVPLKKEKNRKMDKKKQIRNIILGNRENIAFVIGNGINQRFFKGQIPLWNELIKSLSGSFLPNGQNAPNDISFTELFDLIELSAVSNHGPIRELIEYLKDNNIGKYKNLLDIYTVDFEKILQIANAPNNVNNAVNHVLGSKSLESYKKTHSEYIKGCRKWCMSNRDDSESLSDGQCVERFMEMASNPIKIKMMKNTVKRTVARTFAPELNNSDLTKLMIFFQSHDVPVLTTNYDTLMSQSLHLFKHKKIGTSFTDFYPWNIYFSDKELEHPASGFGIWHINGMVDYPRSIKLGVSDYMGNVERARKMLLSHDFNEFFNGMNQTNWSGYYTWLHAFFNKDLFFFGLKLNRDEVFLRWLLIQRAKYSQMYNIKRKGWFVDRNISKETMFFLEQLGFEVVNIRKYDTLYNALN